MAKAPSTPQTVGANGLGYFDELGDALAVNPPTDEQRRTAIDSAKSLGVGPGRHPTSNPGADQAALTQAVTDERAKVEVGTVAGGKDVNGWRVNLNLGESGSTFGLFDRAAVARHYWGANVAAESLYPR